MDPSTLLLELGLRRAEFVAFARKRVGADAEEVVQRALLRAVAAAPTLRHSDRARAWFFRILRHAIVDHRRATKGAIVPLALAAQPLPGEQEGACACAVRLLTKLPPRYAEALQRVDVEGGGPDRVARDLGISSTNLRVRLHRGRRLLRGEVERYCGVESHLPCLDCGCDSLRCCGGPRPAAARG